MAAKNRDIAASVASHLVKVEPEEAKKQAGGSIWPMRLAGPPRCISKKIRDGILSFSVLPK
jgi:hypothetical protein